MMSSVLAELRLLTSMNLDARALLAVVLAGDERLHTKFRTPDVAPIASRIRNRLELGATPAADIRLALARLLEHAGRPDLMTEGVLDAIAQHATGNLRAATTMADNLLTHALQQDRAEIDEQAFFEVFKVPDERMPKNTPKRSRRRPSP